MIDILEDVINSYYFYSNKILLGFSLVFLIIITTGVCLNKVDRRYIINKLINNTFFALIIICIGHIFYLLNLTPEIKYIHFNVLIFISATVGVSLYTILQCIMFMKIKIPFLQVSKYIQYIIYFEIFLLAITSHLDFMECFVGILGIISIEVIANLLEKIEEKTKFNVAKEYDYPNSELYYTREKQLEKFITILEQQKYEPYAIMISGDWGIGKSSFVLALEKKLNNDSFIWIRAGSEKSVSEIMLEISEQVLDVLKKSNILIEKGSIIEKYFLTFSNLLDNGGLGIVNKFLDIFTVNKNGDSKDYLNSKLEELNKTLYLIIDDLDRCDMDYQLKMFKVIRESTELKNCKTIFLVDKKIFLNEGYNASYIEKYISYTLDLCKVGYQEIVSNFIDNIYLDEFIEEINHILLKDRDTKKVKEVIINYPTNIIEIFNQEIAKVKESIRDKRKNEIQNENEKIEDYSKTIKEIQKNITNSRKVKNYLKGIKRDILNINNGIEIISKEFQQVDWLVSIVQVQFIKNILPDIFTNIKLNMDIAEFGKNYESYSIPFILGLKYGFLITDEKKEAVLNYIIYQIHTIDFLQVKTRREKYYDEFHSDKAIIKHINEYVGCAESYEDLEKILLLCKTQCFDSITDKEKFIKDIYDLLSKQSSIFKANNINFLKISTKLIIVLKQLGLSEKDKRACISEGYMITRRTIVDNSSVFKDVLYILFKISDVNKYWDNIVSDVNELYSVLKKINNNVYIGLEDEVNKLLSITTFYKNLETELRGNEYKSLEIECKRVFKQIDIIFEICQFWDDVESILNEENDEEIPYFKQYFMLEGIYSFKDDAFLHISNLNQALNALKQFYILKEESYESNYSLLFLSLLNKIQLKYELNSEWFENRENEINKMLKEIAEKIYVLDKGQDDSAQDVIDKIKIYVFKFNQNCESDTYG